MKGGCGSFHASNFQTTFVNRANPGKNFNFLNVGKFYARDESSSKFAFGKNWVEPLTAFLH